MNSRVRLWFARLIAGLSYNIALIGYIIAAAVIASVLIDVFSTSSTPEAVVVPTYTDLFLAQQSFQQSVGSVALAMVVTFFVVGLSAVLLFWVPYVVAKKSSQFAQWVAKRIFVEQPLSGVHMFTAKLFVFLPAVVILTILYIMFMTPLMFQLLITGVATTTIATALAALRLLIIR